MNIIETNLSFGALSKRSKTTRAILHHADAEEASAATIHQWHKNQGWTGIGYHFVVRKNGTIERGRPEWAVGAHASGSNSDSIGICFEGDYMSDTMPDAQKKSGIELLNYVKQKYGFSTVQGHRDVYPTSCPGQKFPFNDISSGRMSYSDVGWHKDSKGWWYRMTDGGYANNGWMQLDAWYYFDAAGYAIHDAWHESKGKWYYFGSDCRMVTGWKKVKEKWYYMDASGAMVIGKIALDGYDYLLDDSGAMVTGWHQDRDDWYYYNEDKNCQPVGSLMCNHWIGKYYLKDDGRMAKSETLQIGGKEYTFADDGKAE